MPVLTSPLGSRNEILAFAMLSSASNVASTSERGPDLNTGSSPLDVILESPFWLLVDTDGGAFFLTRSAQDLGVGLTAGEGTFEV